MRRFTMVSLIAGFALIAAGALRADDTPTPTPTPSAAPAPNAEKTGKHDPVKHVLSKFDKNNDGALDATELAAFVTAHDKRVAETGNGKEVAPAPTAEKLMKKFDANGDGKLDATELQAMLKELHARREAHRKVATPSAAT